MWTALCHNQDKQISITGTQENEGKWAILMNKAKKAKNNKLEKNYTEMEKKQTKIEIFLTLSVNGIFYLNWACTNKQWMYEALLNQDICL